MCVWFYLSVSQSSQKMPYIYDVITSSFFLENRKKKIEFSVAIATGMVVVFLGRRHGG